MAGARPAGDHLVVPLTRGGECARRYTHTRDDQHRRPQCLDTQREHVLGILEGLSEEQLRRPVLPSGWSPLAMVKHLALAVEHYWVRCIVAGESLDFFTQNDLYDQGAWRRSAHDTGPSIFSLYRSEIARSNEIIRATPLESLPAQREEWWGSGDVADLRFIMLHLDAARELIDGRQWLAFLEDDESASGE